MRTPRRLRARVMILALLAWTPAASSGQAGGQDVRQEFWLDWNGSWSFRPELDLRGQAGWRARVGSPHRSRFVLRSLLASTDGGIEWVAGVASFYTLTSASDIVELRPFQGLRASWPNGQRLRVGHYFRAEERITWRTEDGAPSTALRLRYRLQSELRLTGDAAEGWRLLLFGEAFRRVLGTTLGQEESSRVGLGVERGSGRFRFRFESIWQRSERLQTLFTRDGQATDAVYFRFRVLQRLGW
ncbi:MAG: DUF2490 domain-containing protein [Gemmatimonadota bacterium]